MTGRGPDQLLREGIDAFHQGRMADARARFESAAAAGSTSTILWMLLAVARRACRDFDGEEAAINRLLELEPQSVRGRIMKGDCLARAGDYPTAIKLYRGALRLAQGRSLSAEVQAEVGRAEQALAHLERRGYEAREARLRERGFPPEQWSSRLRHSLELAGGQRKPFLQQPTAFNYVELPHIQFYDRAEFDWAPAVEAATSAIGRELAAFLETWGTDDFRPYIQADAGEIRIDSNKALANNKDWSALFLCEGGRMVPELIEHFPRTWEAIRQAPLQEVAEWGPTIMFSLLKAGARINPHVGMFNTRLICHLPLIVPPNCRFRVGNEVREWETGKLLIFDDTIEHEAWNDSDQDRVVLIFDIWRPELTEIEKEELEALFAPDGAWRKRRPLVLTD